MSEEFKSIGILKENDEIALNYSFTLQAYSKLII